MNETFVSVAVIEHVGGHGGMDYYDVGLCRGLLAAGCHVSLYTCDETADPAVANLRFRPVFGRLFASQNRWMRACRFLKESSRHWEMRLSSGKESVTFISSNTRFRSWRK